MGELENDETRADVLLREALRVMEPLARQLVASGVPYPVFAQSLKSVFLNAASDELRAQGKRTTDSALSLLSGVHRKDVRAMTDSATPAERLRVTSMAKQVCAAWRYEPTWLDELGQPLALPVRGPQDAGPSFERLSQSVSKDFHARSVLDELLRLGVVELRGEMVLLKADEFIPTASFAESARIFANNVSDHVAASMSNLRSDGAAGRPNFLEHSVFVDEITAESAEKLQQLARNLWSAAVRKMVRSATEVVESDRAVTQAQRSHRFRFGAYCFHELDRSVGRSAASAVDGEDVK